VVRRCSVDGVQALEKNVLFGPEKERKENYGKRGGGGLWLGSHRIMGTSLDLAKAAQKGKILLVKEGLYNSSGKGKGVVPRPASGDVDFQSQKQ